MLLQALPGNTPLSRLAAGPAVRRTWAIYDPPFAAGGGRWRIGTEALLVFFLNAAFSFAGFVALFHSVTRLAHNLPLEHFTGFFMSRALQWHTFSRTENTAFVLSQSHCGKQ
jgi:hypothetical protein